MYEWHLLQRAMLAANNSKQQQSSIVGRGYHVPGIHQPGGILYSGVLAKQLLPYRLWGVALFLFLSPFYPPLSRGKGGPHACVCCQTVTAV